MSSLSHQASVSPRQASALLRTTSQHSLGIPMGGPSGLLCGLYLLGSCIASTLTLPSYSSSVLTGGGMSPAAVILRSLLRKLKVAHALAWGMNSRSCMSAKPQIKPHSSQSKLSHAQRPYSSLSCENDITKYKRKYNTEKSTVCASLTFQPTLMYLTEATNVD